MFKQYKPITCADGFTMSVQASSMSYCEPRTCEAESYIAVEVGYPSEKEVMLMPWAENRDNPTETVYGRVPVTTVALVCAKHGGMISGELPPGVPHFTKEMCEVR
jgi:hypothetical protein